MTEPNQSELLNLSRRQVDILRQKIQDVDWGLTSGKFPRESMEHLKTAVDDLRTRVWAILTSYSSGDGLETLQKFRLRRASENLAGLARELAVDPRMWHDDEVRRVKGAAEHLLRVLEVGPRRR